MDLFEKTESYNMATVVDDSRAFVRKLNPRQPDEDRDSYNQRLLELTNDEIERRILVSGKKRPDYSNQNICLKKS